MGRISSFTDSSASIFFPVLTVSTNQRANIRPSSQLVWEVGRTIRDDEAVVHQVPGSYPFFHLFAAARNSGPSPCRAPDKVTSAVLGRNGGDHFHRDRLVHMAKLHDDRCREELLVHRLHFRELLAM